MPTPFNLEELERLSDEQWGTDLTIQRMGETLEGLELTQSLGTLRSLRELLEGKRTVFDNLERKRPGIKRMWEGWVSRCLFADVVSLSDAEIDSLFRTRIVAVVRTYDDLRKPLDEQLRPFDYHEALVPKWTLLKSALQENIERIGKEDIVKEGGRRQAPTVGAWVKEYRNFLGGNIKPGALEEAQFFIKNDNARKLSGEDKQTLLKILQLLDFFVNPPETDVAPTGHSIQEARSKLNAPRPTFPSTDIWQQAQAIEPIIEQLLQEDSDRVDGLVERVWDWSEESIARSTNLPRVLAAVRVLAKRGMAHAVATGAPKEIVGKLQGASGGNLVGFLRATLQALYQDVWGMPEEDAAKEASHIGSILSKNGHLEYLELAYYDMMEKRFRWKV